MKLASNMPLKRMNTKFPIFIKTPLTTILELWTFTLRVVTICYAAETTPLNKGILLLPLLIPNVLMSSITTTINEIIPVFRLRMADMLTFHIPLSKAKKATITISPRLSLPLVFSAVLLTFHASITTAAAICRHITIITGYISSFTLTTVDVTRLSPAVYAVSTLRMILAA